MRVSAEVEGRLLMVLHWRRRVHGAAASPRRGCVPPDATSAHFHLPHAHDGLNKHGWLLEIISAQQSAPNTAAIRIARVDATATSGLSRHSVPMTRMQNCLCDACTVISYAQVPKTGSTATTTALHEALIVDGCANATLCSCTSHCCPAAEYFSCPP